MRLLLILIFTFFSANTFALSYEYQTTVCAEITVQDKSTKNCAGNAVFNQASAGKYNLVITFKVKDFEIEDSRTNKKFEKTIERNLQKNIIFQSPEFTAEEWTEKLKDVFHLIKAELIVAEDNLIITDAMLLKKKVNEEMVYQIEAVIPIEKAQFIHLPKGLKGTKTIHLTLVIPQSEIKGTKF
jgi:hypothetical protein